MNAIGLAFLGSLALLGPICFSPLWFPALMQRRLLKNASNLQSMRKMHAKVREQEAKSLAKKIAKEIARTATMLAQLGECETRDKRVATWFQSKGYEVVHHPRGSAYSTSEEKWTIKVPVITEKEMSDLIVK